MRIKRGKHFKKIVTFYRNNYEFVEPFMVLIDGNFIQACHKVQFDIKTMLMRLLDGVVHINIRLL